MKLAYPAITFVDDGMILQIQLLLKSQCYPAGFHLQGACENRLISSFVFRLVFIKPFSWV